MRSLDWVTVPDDVNTEVEAFAWHAGDGVSTADEYTDAHLVVKHRSGARCQYQGVSQSDAETLRDAVRRGDSVIFEHKLVAVRDMARERSWNTTSPPDSTLID